MKRMDLSSASQPPVSEGLNSLMVACQQGLEHEVRAILYRKPSLITGRDRSGKTALHYCAENRTLACSELILNADPTLINTRDEEGYTALHLAVISGNKMITKHLIRRGADINCKDNEKHSAIHWATVCGELECLEILMEAGADPSTPDIHGAYPIHYAAQMCGPNSEMGNDVRIGLASLRKLISWGVDVDVIDQDGRQPLLWAASAGSSDAILALVNAGANVHAEDKDGLTALHCAASRGHNDCIETLVSLCGAEVDVIDSNGCTALFYAVTLGHADCTQLLLTYGSEPNIQDRKGRTAAHCGAAKGQLETLKILKKNGANLWMRNIRGDLPLHEAIQSARKDLVHWLLESQPSAVNVANSNGRTAIHIAAINNNIEMCKVLMDWGALVNPIMRNTKGQLMTPLDAALYCGNRGCAKYLQLHGAFPASKLIGKDEQARFYINGIDLEGRPYRLVEDDRTTSVSDTLESAVQTEEVKSEFKDADVQVYLSQSDSKAVTSKSEMTQVFFNEDNEDNEDNTAPAGQVRTNYKANNNSTAAKTIEVLVHERKDKGESTEFVENEALNKKGILLPMDSVRNKNLKKKLKVYVPEGVGEVKVIQLPQDDTGKIQMPDDEVNKVPASKALMKPSSLSPLSSDNTVKDSGYSEDKIPLTDDEDDDDELLRNGFKPVLLEIRRKRKARRKLPDIKPDLYDELPPTTIHERKCLIPGRNTNYNHIKAKVNTGRPDVNRNLPDMEKLQSTYGSKSEASRNITQQIQQSLRKYQLERKLFQELQELKHHQIRSGRASENAVVKKLAERFRREVMMPGMRDFEGPFTYKAFEKYLYDQLRLLSSSNHGKVPKPKTVSTVHQKPLPTYTRLDNDSANACVCRTYRCQHATQAYSGTGGKLFPKPTTIRQSILPAISPASSAAPSYTSGKATRVRHRSFTPQPIPLHGQSLSEKFSQKERSRSLDRIGNNTDRITPIPLSKSNSLPSYKNDIESLRKFWRNRNSSEKINRTKDQTDGREIPKPVLFAVANALSKDSNPDDKVMVSMVADDDSSKVSQTYTVKELKVLTEDDTRRLPGLKSMVDEGNDGPVTFEVKHGSEKNIFKLPANKLGNNKWQVTFTIGKSENKET